VCHAALAVAQAICALGIVYLKTAMNSAVVDSVTFSFWRFVFATPLLLVAALRDGVPPLPSMRDTAWFAILGTLLVCNQLFANLGVQLAGALIATCMQPTSPVLSAALAVAMGQERLSLVAAGGILLAVSGAIVVAAGRGHDDSEARGSTVIVGSACLLFNASSFAAYCVLMKQVVYKHTAAVVTGASQALGTAVMAAVVLARQALWADAPGLWLPTAAYGALAYWVVAVSAFSYLLISWANRHLPASTVALYAAVQPAVGATLSVVVLGDWLRPSDLGAIAIVLGMWVVVSRSAP